MAGMIGDRDGIWSEIKEVFILLQEFKCIYCEFPLPKVDSGSADKVALDHDVEHYRPKNRVTPWPTPEVLERRPTIADYQASVSWGVSEGYLRLAFDPFNYVVSCKVCNSSYKGDRFPIAGKPNSRSRKRTALDASEKPLLLFPFGEHGDDPDLFLAFEGAFVRPRPAAGHDSLRARVVIDFFELDTREGLLAGRCLLIQILWHKLEERAAPDPQTKAEAETFLEAVQRQQHLPHLACGRAFIDLYGQDRERARLWYSAANRFLAGKDPAILRALS
ncbi:MAG: hypothetical protein WAM82_18480 [Thermoanaerobaculia bacterium]